MVKTLYSVFDSVAGFYSPVFMAENDAHATRMMESSIDLKHKADFTLWMVARFNTDTGAITESREPRLIEKGINLKGNEQ